VVHAAAAMARGELRVLKIPGDAGLSRANLVALVRTHSDTLQELWCAGRGGGSRGGEVVGCWSPKQVHAALSAAGPRFRRLTVDVRSRGVCAALVEQLTSPVVRVRHLEVRLASLGDEEKVHLFAAIARMGEQRGRALRSSSAVSLTDLASFVSGRGHGEGDACGDEVGNGDGDDEDNLRRLTLSSCGLVRDDAAALVAAINAGAGAEKGVGLPCRALELDLADNPMLGSDGAFALASLVASGAVVSLDAENCGLGEAGAEALGVALASPRCRLESLNIARNFVGARGAAAIARGLMHGVGARTAAAGAEDGSKTGGHRLGGRGLGLGAGGTLRELSMGHNAFGCVGAAAFAAVAAGSSALHALVKLDVSMNGIGAEGVAALAEAVLAAPCLSRRRCFQSCTAAAARTDNFKPEGEDEIVATSTVPCGTPALRELRLEGNPLGFTGARAIARAAMGGSARVWGSGGSPPSLEVLGLSSTSLGAVGAAAVAAAIASPGGPLNRIIHLDLSANDIGECGAGLFVNDDDHDGCKEEQEERDTNVVLKHRSKGPRARSALTALAEDLASASHLRRLNLGYNNMGDAGAAAVAAAVAAAISADARIGSGGLALAELDLQRNSIGDRGATLLAAVLGGDLSCGRGVVLTPKSMGASAGAGTCAGVASLGLQWVDLRSNSIGAAGMAALDAHVAAGRVAANFMPARWTPQPQGQTQDRTREQAGEAEGLVVAAELSCAAPAPAAAPLLLA